MSSATSTSAAKGSLGSGGAKGSGRARGTRGNREPREPQAPPEPLEPPEPQASEGFRRWHFFLLAGLVTATVAVMLSRQSTPEHLVLISLTIIAAGLAAAGFYRMLAPFGAADVTMFSEPLSERARAALQREKMLVLRSIKELEFDRSMGKLSSRDFDDMALRLRTRAMALMQQLDEGAAGYREVIERELRARLATSPAVGRGTGAGLPGAGAAAVRVGSGTSATATAAVARGTCAACGTANDADAAFCKRCGGKL